MLLPRMVSSQRLGIHQRPVGGKLVHGVYPLTVPGTPKLWPNNMGKHMGNDMGHIKIIHLSWGYHIVRRFYVFSIPFC